MIDYSGDIVSAQNTTRSVYVYMYTGLYDATVTFHQNKHCNKQPQCFNIIQSTCLHMFGE